MMQQPFLAVKPYGPAHVAEWPMVVLLNLLVATAYAVTGLAGQTLAFIEGAVTLFWPPSGIAFAALWIGGRRLAPGVVVGAFVTNLIALQAPQIAALIAVGNVLPALVGTMVLRRMIAERSHGGESPGELWRVLWFIVVGALFATMLSATVGTLAVAAGSGDGVSLSSTWLVWWMGDAMGVLIAAPPILLRDRFLHAGIRWRSLFDAMAFGLAGAGIIAGLMFIKNPVWAVELCKLFTLLLSLWAGTRFGLTGPAAVTLLMAIGGVGVTVLGVGPFKRESFYDSFALLHSYLFAEAIAGMLLAAALADLRRVAVAEKLARREAEAASADRIKLLTMISHDVRTPLSGMMGVLQMLGRQSLDAEARQLVALGLRAGGTLTTLVTDILDVARADSGRITLEPAPFDPGRAMADVVALNRDVATTKGLDIGVDGLDRLPALVTGDRARFEQLLGNLVCNAIAYTPAGRVLLTAGWHAGAVRPLVFEIADTGPGIEPDRVPLMFDAFVFEPRPGNRSAGLGLGLHICRRLVELMDGLIAYRPAPAGGSVFRVELPLAQARDIIVATLAPDVEMQQKILLVEDDVIAQTVTAALLTSHGHDVEVADSGAAAVAAAAGGGFDLILMDIDIAGSEAGGLEAASAIRALPGPAALVPIFALTADAMAEHHSQFAAAGMEGVLVKPFALGPGLRAALASGRFPRA